MKDSALYPTIWRWHFYAGLFVLPFILILSITASIYLFKPQIERGGGDHTTGWGWWAQCRPIGSWQPSWPPIPARRSITIGCRVKAATPQ